MWRLSFVLILAACAFLIIPHSPAGAGLRRTHDSLERELQQRLNDGKFEEALPLAEAVVDAIAAEFPGDDVKLDPALERLTILRLQTGHAPDAEPAARRFLALRERRFGTEAPQTAASRNFARHRPGRTK